VLHIISSNFNSDLVDFMCKEGIHWAHWSEMPGIRLAELLGYRMWLYRLINPLMLLCKFKEGRRIRKYALWSFGQGVLARRSFQGIGVPVQMMSDLYYSPEPLSSLEPCERVVNFAAGRKVFLAVGALCKRKGIDILLKAFAGLPTRDWCLVLCGLDKENNLYRMIAEKLGIEERVLFVGTYPVNRIASVYTAAHVLILASRFDGWGTVLNEAASLGLPLIGTDMCGAAWHVIDDGKNGFRVKADSVSALQRGMRNYVDRPDLIGMHGEYSRKLFYEQFTPEKNAERLMAGLQPFLVQRKT